MTGTTIPPAREAAFRVEFWVWEKTRDHDWIGRRPVRPGGIGKPRRAKGPERQFREFFSREAAEQFTANLRRDYGDEVACTIIDLQKPPPPPPPRDQKLPGVEQWPLQRRP